MRAGAREGARRRGGANREICVRGRGVLRGYSVLVGWFGVWEGLGEGVFVLGICEDNGVANGHSGALACDERDRLVEMKNSSGGFIAGRTDDGLRRTASEAIGTATGASAGSDSGATGEFDSWHRKNGV